jgi:hypothetical protein
MSGLGEDDGPTILDDEGRLFGLVNIVDLLVVLLVLAVVVAGAALLFSNSPDDTGTATETETRHVTMNLGTQPDFVAEQITVGDTFESRGSDESATITDLYRYDSNGGTAVVVRATIRGTVSASENTSGDSFRLGGTELRVGQNVPLQTAEYNVEGRLTRIAESGETLPTRQTEFTIETTVPASTAGEVAVGDEYRIAGETVAEITAVQQFPGRSSSERTLLVGLSAQTLDRGGIRFGGSPLRVGEAVPFRNESYQLTGNVVRRGTSTIETTERPFLLETNASASVADDIAAGDEYRLGGQTLVRVESATIYTTDDPSQRRVLLGVSAVTRDSDGMTLFGSREIRLGQSIPIRTGEYDISGEVIRRGSLEQAGAPETLAATLELRDVRPGIADTISVGQTERIGTETTLEITSKSTQPAEILVETQSGELRLSDHPRNLDVELGADLQVRRLDDGGVTFRGEPLRTGDTIPVELGQLRVTVEVSDLGGT